MKKQQALGLIYIKYFYLLSFDYTYAALLRVSL